MTATQPSLLLGLVGYCAFVRSYPLGPALMERLVAPPWPGDDVLVRELNWGPIAIAQQFQAEDRPLTRAVLVAATDRGHSTGTVSCRRWLGGSLDVQGTQQRVFEAVTGVISLDNLLVIGEHFGIWPPELLTVEVQLAEDNVGAFVMSELDAGHLSANNVVGEQPLSAELVPVVARMVELARIAVIEGAAGLPQLQPLHAQDLAPPQAFCHTRGVGLNNAERTRQ